MGREIKTLEQFLEAVASRKAPKPYGIGTARSALASIDGCFSGGFCPEKYFRLASPEVWQGLLKEAGNRLTCGLEGMRIKSTTTVVTTPHCLMEFDAVLTTPRQDRDNDILESRGCETDPNMPGLWQHIPMEPLGKLVTILSKNDAGVEFRGTIADTSLGRDATILVEHGALRISHGFRPEEWEPIFEEGKEIDRYAWPIGFHILKFYVMEWSLVSIPSNEDAVITQYSRQKLHDPLVKAWAEGMATLRTKSVPVTLAKSPSEQIVNVRVEVVGAQPAAPSKSCSCQHGKGNPGMNTQLSKGPLPYAVSTKLPDDHLFIHTLAVSDLRSWATADKDGQPTLDLEKYAQGFAYCSGDPADEKSYHLAHHDVKDGQLHACLQGAKDALSVINGDSRPCPIMPEEHRKAVYEHLAKHFAEFGQVAPPLKPAAKGKAVPHEAGAKADRAAAWDAGQARKQLREYAAAGDAVDFAKYKAGFAWHTGDGTKEGDYKYPHHSAEGGQLAVVFRGVAGVVATLNGAGGDIPEDDRKAVWEHMQKHYEEFGAACPPLKSAQERQDDPKSYEALLAEYTAVKTPAPASKKPNKEERQKMTEMKDLVVRVRDDKELANHHRVLLDKSVNILDEVMEMQVGPENAEEVRGEQCSLQNALLASLVVADAKQLAELRGFHAKLGGMLDGLESQAGDPGLEAAIAELGLV